MSYCTIVLVEYALQRLVDVFFEILHGAHFILVLKIIFVEIVIIIKVCNICLLELYKKYNFSGKLFSSFTNSGFCENFCYGIGKDIFLQDCYLANFSYEYLIQSIEKPYASMGAPERLLDALNRPGVCTHLFII